MDLVAVQEEERKDSGGCHVDVRLENLFNPEEHHRPTHPCLLRCGINALGGVDESSLLFL